MKRYEYTLTLHAENKITYTGLSAISDLLMEHLNYIGADCYLVKYEVEEKEEDE